MFWEEIFKNWSRVRLQIWGLISSLVDTQKNPPNLQIKISNRPWNTQTYEGRIITILADGGNRHKCFCYLSICTEFIGMKAFNCRAWASWPGASGLLAGQETKMAHQEPGIQQAHMLALQGNLIYVNMSSACVCVWVWVCVRERERLPVTLESKRCRKEQM